VGTRFSARPDRPWVPQSLVQNGFRVIPGGTDGQGLGLTPHPSSAEGPRKSRATPLPTLRAFVVYKMGENLTAYLRACLPTYLPACLHTYLPACLHTYLPTYLPTCLHT